MKKFIAVLQLLFVVILAHAQMMNPVKFSTSLKTNGTAVAEIVFNGKSNRDGMSILQVWAQTDLFQPLLT